MIPSMRKCSEAYKIMVLKILNAMERRYFLLNESKWKSHMVKILQTHTRISCYVCYLCIWIKLVRMWTKFNRSYLWSGRIKVIICFHCAFHVFLSFCDRKYMYICIYLCGYYNMEKQMLFFKRKNRAPQM